MPQSSPNPKGLQTAVERALSGRHTFIKQVAEEDIPDEVRERLQSEFENLARQVITSEDLATRIDEAVRNEDSEQVLRTLRQTGLSQDVGVAVDGINADARISLRLCIFGFCLSCDCSW